MTRKERRELRKEHAEQNREFIKRLKPLFEKKYRASLLFEDALMGDDGKAYVNVDLTKIESPFSVFSYNRRMDPEIFDYIDSQVFFLRAVVPVVINFDDGGKYNEAMKERIRRYVKRHYTLEYEDKRMEHKKSIIFALILLFSGLLILGIHFLLAYQLSGIKSVEPFNELTLIITWMLVWQSMDLFFISGHNKRVEVYNSGQLALAEVTFGKPHLE